MGEPLRWRGFEFEVDEGTGLEAGEAWCARRFRIGEVGGEAAGDGVFGFTTSSAVEGRRH